MIASMEKVTSPMIPIPLGPLPDRPLVSVLIANYNYARYVGRAIESVLGQTYSNFEVIVCDDGSTDDSCEVIGRYTRQDPRVRLLRKKNGGMASAWNLAYPECHGQILSTLDSDDAFSAGKLDAVVDRFHNLPDRGLLVHSMMVVNESGEEIQRIPFLTRFENGWIADHVVRRGGRWRYMPTSALAFRRELGRYMFPIPEKWFFKHADAMVFTLAPLLTGVVSIDEPLSYYRVHGSNSIGGGLRDRTSAMLVKKFSEQTADGVNERLAEIGLPQRLDVKNNLEFLQAEFVLSLFDGKARAPLLRQYHSLASALLSDDLYGTTQKLSGLIAYGAAILLPTRLRSWWIARTLGYSRTKQRVREAVSRLRGLFPPSPSSSLG